MAKQVAPGRYEICEVVATLIAHAGGMNERTDSRRFYQLNDRYWQAVVA
jgi:protein involved in polysaccharide export with SLBB domain